MTLGNTYGNIVFSMNHNHVRHNNIKPVFTLTKKWVVNIDTIRDVAPTLSKKYSDKKLRDIAIESHIKKYKIPSIISNEPK